MKNKNGLLFFLCVIWMSFVAGRFVYAEDWKGKPEDSVLSLGALTGVGLVDQGSGLALFGTVSKKIVNHGFIPEITDSVSVECALGPVFLSVGSAMIYSVHLRWDFEKDQNWTLYALGGLGGNVLSGRSELYPRFGIGAFYKMSGPLNGRVELSHEAILLGLNVPFY